MNHVVGNDGYFGHDISAWNQLTQFDMVERFHLVETVEQQDTVRARIC